MITQTQRILHDAHIARLRRFERERPAAPAPVPAISLPVFPLVPAASTWPPTTQEIQAAVAASYDVSRALICSSCKHAWIVLPRQVGMYLTRVLAFLSYSEVGRQFGGRDPSTVIFAVKKIERLRHTNSAVADAIATITASLRGAVK